MSRLKIVLIVLFGLAIFWPSSTQAAFSDLPESHHHFLALSYLEYEEIIQGYSDGTVRPENLINRAELVKILVEGLNKETDSTHKNCFPDVQEEWFAKYICYAQEQDWVGGYPDGTFQPAQNVNKVEALKIILNAFGIQESPGNDQLFSDVPAEEWYAGFLNAALKKNVIEEKDGTFNPSNPRSRGEIAEMVARIKMIQHAGDPEYNDWIKAEFETFILLYRLRLANGVTQKLKLNPTLTGTARAHSQDMSEVIGDMSHSGSDGRLSYERMEDAGIAEILRTGENVGRGALWSGRSIFDAIEGVHTKVFMPEDPNVCNHRTTILSVCLPFTDVGIGVYVKDNLVYFTQDFITSGYADNIMDLSVMQVPEEYENNPIYDVDKGEDYVKTIVSSCDEVRVRSAYFIDVGVYEINDQCGIYEYAWPVTPNLNLIQTYLDNQVFSIRYSSSYYTSEQPTENSPFIEIMPDLSNGWSSPQIENMNLPAYFDIGEVVEMTFENGFETKIFRLDFSQEGWTTVTEL